MSTKSTIAHGNKFHFYNEVLDDNFVYLELKDVQFEAPSNRVMVPIPVAVWEVIRRFSGVDLDWADKSDDEIKHFVEVEVDARIQNHEKNGKARILGGLVYGSAADSREKQIAAGIDHFKKRRAQEASVKKGIEELEATNPLPISAK